MSWAEVHGHEDQVRAYQRIVARGRLGHAYLFVGPEGIGKKRFAMELGKALLCEQRSSDAALQACDACPGCLQVVAATHPDYQLAGLPEGKQEFPLELMHDLIRSLSMRPARGRHRIAIVDDADVLNEESANAFLKTLEEPPPASLLVLVATSTERLLPTIVSRCQFVRFKPLPAEFIAQRLVEDEAVPSLAVARQVAAEAQGSFTRARLLADPASNECRQRLLDGLVADRPDPVGLAGHLVTYVEEDVKDGAIKRERGRLMLAFMLSLLREALRLKVDGSRATSGPPSTERAAHLARRASVDQVLAAMDRCLEAGYQIDRRVQLVLVLEGLMDHLARLLR